MVARQKDGCSSIRCSSEAGILVYNPMNLAAMPFMISLVPAKDVDSFPPMAGLQGRHDAAAGTSDFHHTVGLDNRCPIRTEYYLKPA